MAIKARADKADATLAQHDSYHVELEQRNTDMRAELKGFAEKFSSLKRRLNEPLRTMMRRESRREVIKTKKWGRKRKRERDSVCVC